MGFGSSSEAAQAPSRCPELLGFPETRRLVRTKRQLAAPSLRFLPLQRLPRPEQRHKLAGPASPDRLRLQVFSTSWHLHPLRACRPCFMPDPLLGSPSRAFFLLRSLTLFPAPFPSWRSTAFRVLLRARVRHSVQRFRLKTERVALLGFFPSRVFPLSALARPSPFLPSCGCPLGRKRPNRLHFRVSHAKSTACLSQDRRPSWGLWPSGRHARSSIAWILESPPKAPGVRHRPLVSLSSNP